ncbi:hypothetical protein [Actinomadura rupiterrae]|uniref:hypothetical protein n=1 Tax=Actinomadura rupiterrae TaxID=559627 RepID=UPI0020A30D9B|nr:hypothetical protein [Actinomadura rupiterrae]MCP2342104.1 hypothetical protein [Actinomadura rupiterrae]
MHVKALSVARTAVICATSAPLLAGAGAATASTHHAAAGASAARATTQFPPLNTPFQIRHTFGNGKTLCATLNKAAHSIRLSACDPNNAAQRWERRAVDAGGYGTVFGEDGYCIFPFIDSSVASGKACTNPANDKLRNLIAFKQRPNGTVVNAQGNMTWLANGGNTDFPSFSAKGSGSGGDPFDLIALN